MSDFLLQLRLHCDETQNFADQVGESLKSCLKCGRPMLVTLEFTKAGNVRELYGCEDEACGTFYEFIYGDADEKEKAR
jgi:hypothetical protein